MDVTNLEIAGAKLFEFKEYLDARGSFAEIFNSSDFSVAQINKSVSQKGVLRGIHFADVPPGQAKYVTCLTGAIFDVMVDLRVSSPTFKKWIGIELTADSNMAISIPAGVGHGFLALEENSTVMYLCDQRYNPSSEHELNPLDKTINISWPKGFDFKLSEKDRLAPSFEELLPRLPA